MPSSPVVLIGYRDQENLGLGYLAAVLAESGHNVSVLDLGGGQEQLVAQVTAFDPLLVGISVIFQYHTPDVARLVKALRGAGIGQHICAGGHYPSLKPEGFLSQVPGLDSVVRFEGEEGLPALVDCLAAGADWRDLPGLAYVDGGRAITTPLRPLIRDLDALPFPRRQLPWRHCLGVPVAAMLASRGCVRRCSFCSIQRFYGTPPGKARRVRSPANVVAEMRLLHGTHGVRIFLFQDDDFAMRTSRDRAWAREFADELTRAGLAGDVLWKVSCRADEIEAELMAELQSVGLGMVYLGLESGNEVGLQTLNKRTTVEDNRRAVAVLAELGIDLEFGFMLFDPSSTFELVLENARFLREVCGKGLAPAPFGKMLPYAGTDIEETLRSEGRLVDDVLRPDYRWPGGRLHAWFGYLSQVLHPFAFGGSSLMAQLRWAQFEVVLLRRFQPSLEGLRLYQERIQRMIGEYNEAYLHVVEASAPVFQRHHERRSHLLGDIHEAATRRRWRLEGRIPQARLEFLRGAGVPLELIAGLDALPAAMLS